MIGLPRFWLWETPTGWIATATTLGDITGGVGGHGWREVDRLEFFLRLADLTKAPGGPVHEVERIVPEHSPSCARPWPHEGRCRTDEPMPIRRPGPALSLLCQVQQDRLHDPCGGETDEDEPQRCACWCHETCGCGITPARYCATCNAPWWWCGVCHPSVARCTDCAARRRDGPDGP